MTIIILSILLTAATVCAVLFTRRASRSELHAQKLHEENVQLNRDVSRLQNDNQHLQKNLTDRFENLANRIFEHNSTKLAGENEKSIAGILNPLKEKIKDFEKRVEETYGHEAKERFALQKEIQRLMELNLQMGKEASSLTKALKGDVKTQGTWGEIVLERLLETSGLRDGHEYTRQGEGLALRDEEGRLLKPDILVRLPEDKHIIIDSKVSLVAYERMVNDSENNLKAHAESVFSHIKGLSDKHYQAIKGLKSPEFVLLFMPIEGAFSAALQNEPEMFQFAWERKIILVSPTTLLATLRTVASIWKHEKQSKNAVEIARQGGALYDEFARLMDDLQDVGKGITQTQAAFDSTLKRLSTGKGNLLGRVEKLRELGAKAKKELETNESGGAPVEGLLS